MESQRERRRKSCPYYFVFSRGRIISEAIRTRSSPPNSKLQACAPGERAGAKLAAEPARVKERRAAGRNRLGRAARARTRDDATTSPGGRERACADVLCSVLLRGYGDSGGSSARPDE